MKVYNYFTFFQSIISSQVCEKITGVIAPDYEDRKQITTDICRCITKKQPDLALNTVHCCEEEIALQMREIRSQDLFSPKRLFLFHDLHLLNGAELKEFFACMQELDSHTFVVFGSAKLDHTTLLSPLKADLYLLDLAKEKPWDRKKRFIHKMISFAKQKGKILSQDTANAMIEHFGMNIAMLLTEIKRYCLQTSKEIIFSAKELGAYKQQKIWQLVDQLVSKGAKELPLFVEGSDFFSFISQMRSRMYLGIAIKENNQEFLSKSKLSPSMLSKIKPSLESKPLSFFLHGLQTIYEIEYLSRQGNIKEKDLIDILYGKINQLHQRYTKKHYSIHSS